MHLRGVQFSQECKTNTAANTARMQSVDDDGDKLFNATVLCVLYYVVLSDETECDYHNRLIGIRFQILTQ